MWHSDDFGLSSLVFQKIFSPEKGIPHTSILARVIIRAAQVVRSFRKPMVHTPRPWHVSTPHTQIPPRYTDLCTANVSYNYYSLTPLELETCFFGDNFT